MNSLRRYDNILLFTNGAIGDSLMGALCADSATKKLTGSKIIILAPRNAMMLRNLFSAYPHIQVYEANWRHFLNVLNVVVQVIGQKNMLMNQLIFKKIPFPIRLLASLLTIRRGSSYLHFAQKGISGGRAGNETIIFDYHLPVYENLARLFNTQNLAVSPSVPRYHFIHTPSVLKRYDLIRSSYVVVHPCAFSASRSLPVVRWASILKYLAVNFSDMKIIITGSKQDSLFVQKISEAADRSIPFINLAVELPMTELANILDGACGYIGVDTGITHLAGVLQKRSVIIGNLSNPCWLPRYNKNAIILTENKNCTCDGEKGGDCFYYLGKEKYYKCMLDIPEESIFESIKSMLIQGSQV